MTLAEQFEAAVAEIDEFIALSPGGEWISSQTSSGEILIGQAFATIICYRNLLDRAAELARDNERVVQSIVRRDIPK